jgi:hypothetical protein
VATAAKKQCAFHHFHQISAEGVMDAVCAASVRAWFHVPCPSTPIFLVAVHFMLLVRQSNSSSNVTHKHPHGAPNMPPLSGLQAQLWALSHHANLHPPLAAL